MTYKPEEIADLKKKVCAMIATGLSVYKIARIEGMPGNTTIFTWLCNDTEFSDEYARARERRADARSERIDDLVERVELGTLGYAEARVIIDAEKWQAGHENAPRYGDRVNLNGNLTVRSTDEQLESRASQLLGKAGAGINIRGDGTSEGAA